jgi:hypothetical protein
MRNTVLSGLLVGAAALAAAIRAHTGLGWLLPRRSAGCANFTATVIKAVLTRARRLVVDGKKGEGREPGASGVLQSWEQMLKRHPRNCPEPDGRGPGGSTGFPAGHSRVWPGNETPAGPFACWHDHRPVWFRVRPLSCARWHIFRGSRTTARIGWRRLQPIHGNGRGAASGLANCRRARRTFLWPDAIPGNSSIYD